MSGQSVQSVQPVVLVREHRHGGRLFAPGAVLELAPQRAAWLVSMGVAQRAPAMPAAVQAKAVKE